MDIDERQESGGANDGQGVEMETLDPKNSEKDFNRNDTKLEHNM